MPSGRSSESVAWRFLQQRPHTHPHPARSISSSPLGDVSVVAALRACAVAGSEDGGLHRRDGSGDGMVSLRPCFTGRRNKPGLRLSVYFPPCLVSLLAADEASSRSRRLWGEIVSGEAVEFMFGTGPGLTLWERGCSLPSQASSSGKLS